MRYNFKNLLKNNIFILIALAIAGFLSFYNLGDIEFWGEDEAQTLFYASRFIMGLKAHSLSNLTALYTNTTFSAVILIQVPFILLLGVTELAARFPNALINLATLLLVYKIGSLFLKKSAVNFLVMLYAVSGAIGLFKNSLGVGFYIFFILLAFYKLEIFLHYKLYKSYRKNSDFYTGLIFLAIALTFVPDAYFYLPFFLIWVLFNIKNIGVKTFFKGLVGPLAVLGFFIFYEFILPLQLTGSQNKTYEHFVSRREGLDIAFNLKPLILGYIHNYSVFFVIGLVISVGVLAVFYFRKREKPPPALIRVIFMFLPHFFIWMFLVKNECGHLMNHYLVLMMVMGLCFQVIWDYVKNKKKNIRQAVIAIIIVMLLLNSYHTFMLFNHLSMDKQKYPLYYAPYKVPCGYLDGRKVGIKSIAYLLRKELNPNEVLASDKGVSFNFLYMGQGFISISSLHAIELLVSGQDIYKSHNVRFIGLSPSSLSLDYVEEFDSMGYNKLIVMEGNKQVYFVYDILKKGEVKEIGRDQYDVQYHKEYASDVITAIPYYLYY